MQNLVELFFPARCVCCKKRILEPINPYICAPCREEIESLYIEGGCVCCGTPLKIPIRVGEEKGHRCGECLRRPPAYSLARSLFLHKEPVKTLVHNLKYHHTSTGLAAIKTLLSTHLVEFNNCDLVLPVPLHFKRLRQRGFNQSLLLAKAVFPKRSTEIRSDLLKRVRNTLPQTTMDRNQRKRNVSKAFIVANAVELSGRDVCLVDDVFTTGSTVNECSLILSSCGARSVKVFTLSRSLS